MSARERFQYVKRTPDQVQSRADQRGGLFDAYLGDQFQSWQVKEGDHQVRILPPTYDRAQHYGLDIFVHYGIGADNQVYLCLEMQEPGTCPICAERRQIQSTDPEYAKTLRPTKRVLVWMIDRDKESEGPQLWSMSWTLDRDLSILSIDKRSGEVLCIDDPQEGYDVAFARKGTTKTNTKYMGLQISRRATPLASDQSQEQEWLRFVVENPLPSTLVFYSRDRIAKVFAGGADASSGSEPVLDQEPEPTIDKPRAERPARVRVPAEPVPAAAQPNAALFGPDSPAIAGPPVEPGERGAGAASADRRRALFESLDEPDDVPPKSDDVPY